MLCDINKQNFFFLLNYPSRLLESAGILPFSCQERCGKGDIYIPVPVIGKGGGGDGGVGGQDTAGLHCRTEGSSFER